MTEPEWSTKDIIHDLKTDLVGRFDKQDAVLLDIDRKVDGKADKVDLARLEGKHEVLTSRVSALEGSTSTMASVREHKLHTWRIAAAVVGLTGTLAGGVTGLIWVLR